MLAETSRSIAVLDAAFENDPTRGKSKVVMKYAADGSGQLHFPSLRDWTP